VIRQRKRRNSRRARGSQEKRRCAFQLLPGNTPSVLAIVSLVARTRQVVPSPVDPHVQRRPAHLLVALGDLHAFRLPVAFPAPAGQGAVAAGRCRPGRLQCGRRRRDQDAGERPYKEGRPTRPGRSPVGTVRGGSPKERPRGDGPEGRHGLRESRCHGKEEGQHHHRRGQTG
jgi:hypothetical protein